MAETAPRSSLSREEAAALGVALFGHIALVAALVWFKPADSLPPPPGRMAVTISDALGPVSSAPTPEPDAALDRGPVLGDAAPPPEPSLAKDPPPPLPQTPARSQAPQAKPQPKPLAPARTPPDTRPPRPGAKPGASAFDQAFGQGIPGANNKGQGKNPPAEATGAQRSSWTSLIGGKVLRPWNACKVSGLDTDQLYVDVSFVLATDGSILSLADPVVGGINEANRPQVAPFKACAVRAIRLAAPFSGLPAEYYNDWKSRKLRLRKREQ